MQHLKLISLKGSAYYFNRLSKGQNPTYSLPSPLISLQIPGKRMASFGVGNNNQENISVGFEIFGKVQGVYFRKHTHEKGESLGLRGYCENTTHETVVGVLEGERHKVGEMKEWLQKTGSPKSRIDKAEFTEEKSITNFHYDDFTIRR